MKTNNLQIYPYQELPPQKLTDMLDSYLFLLEVETLSTHLPIEYCVEFHCVKNHLFVPRMSPMAWRNKEHCFKKLSSSQGIFLNVKKILYTLLTIYDQKWGSDESNYLIASGNYTFAEKGEGPSKKALVYKRYFARSPFADKYSFYELTDITYIIMSNPTIPLFYEACKLFAIYNDERLKIDN